MVRPSPAPNRSPPPRPRRVVAVACTLLALLVAAGGAAWHFLADEHGRDLSAAATAGAHAVAPTVPVESIAAADDGSGPSRDADLAETTAQDAATVATVAEAERYGIAVKVVRHRDGLPVPGARLFLLDSRKTSLDELPRLAADPIELRTRASARLRSDENGLVRVPRPVANLWVLALDDTGRGCIEVDASSFAPRRLELVPRLTVEVRVVDETGAPCRDVEVALVPKGDPPRRSTWRATSGADGLAKFADVDLEFSFARSAWKAPKVQSFEVGPTLLMREPPTVPVDLDALPAEPLVLQMPATGALEFQVVDLAGEPLAAAGSVKVVVSNVGKLDVPLDLQGRGSVPRFGLGCAGEARPLIPGRACDAVKFAGPMRAGDTVEVALPAGPIGPIVVGHVTDAAGTPLGGFDLDASLDAFDRARDGTPLGSSGQRVKCESDGAFRLDYSRAGMWTTAVTSLQLWLRAMRDADEPLGQPIEARFDVVVPVSGEVDVGVVKLAPPPLIVAGRVVDEDGLPVGDAGIRVQIDKPVKELYRAVHLSGTRSAADGRFEIRGEIPAGRLKVGAGRGGYLASKQVPFSAGDPDVTLELHMGGGVEGSVRLPEGFAAEVLNARLLLATDPAHTRETRHLNADGSFEFGLVVPGLWDFELLLGRDDDQAEKLAVIHQVGVHRAELSQDPRLQEIDLASLTHLVDVTVRVPGGDLAPGGAIGRSASWDGNRGTLSIPLKAGRALVPCPTVPMPLHVVVPGFLAQTVRASDAPIDVLLYRGYPLRLRVQGALAKFPELVALRVSAIPRDDAIAAVGPAPSGSVKDGEATLVVPSTGRYRARIEFGPPPDPNASPDDARRRDRRTPRSDVDFEVKDVADEQVVELKVKG